MFCKKCGKELTEDAVFCQFCGTPQNSKSQELIIVQPLFNFSKIGEKIKEIGYEKLFNIISCILFLISIIVRFIENEIYTVYSLIGASDDYFVLSVKGKIILLILMAVQILSVILIAKMANSQNVKINKKPIITDIIIMLIICILCIFIQLPAPY